MKRVNNLFNKICSIENLMAADKIARRGKSQQYGVRQHDKRRGCNIITLHNTLMEKRFTTGTYKQFNIKDPKPRVISALPYYPDRIVHHAIMSQLEPVFVASFTADTYSCIKGRGIHACKLAVEKALKDITGTTYFLKLDVTKFYPSIDHDILKALLSRKIKDKDLMELLGEIIDSAPGVPIGNYLSQYFANFYLSPLDHFVKEVLQVKNYYRYADDILILADNKDYLHGLLSKIRIYLDLELKLAVKKNYKVWPVDEGIDFLGFVFRHHYILLRKSIKKSWARAVKRGNNRQSLAAYEGWAKHCNCINLTKKLTYENIQRPGDKTENPQRRQNHT